MRSLLAAATLALAAALAQPALAQALTPEESAAKTDPGLGEAKPAGNTEAKSETKSAAKGAAKGDAKPAKGAKATRGEPKAAAIPPAADQVPPPGGRNVTATGKTMPPTSGRGGAAPLKTSTEVEMLKAQKAAEERNKAWDAKMRRTMSTICNGC